MQKNYHKSLKKTTIKVQKKLLYKRKKNYYTSIKKML